MYYKKLRGKIQCTLCPHHCILTEGKSGICMVRRNVGGKIKSLSFGIVSGTALDPIEKKPLYHYYPGSKIFSVGSVGCNLKCNYCQNWQISQSCNGDQIEGTLLTSDEIVKKAQQYPDNIGIAYTYNEPVVWIEFMKDIAEKVHNHRMKNVMVSNGFINQEPLEDLLRVIDAFNIDLKAFTDDFYRNMTGGFLNPVLETLKSIRAYGRHLELTTLIIPGKNDQVEKFSEMIDWIEQELGNDTVLHLSRYFPRYKQTLAATPEPLLLDLYEVARKKLNYVYLGNLNSSIGNNTHCPKCGTELIHRSGYHISVLSTFQSGQCLNCNQKIPIK